MFLHGRGGPEAAFAEEEAGALRRMISDYLTLLEEGPSGPDPVMARLFPPASLDDEAVESSFRDLTLGDLGDAKRSNAEIALDSLGDSGAWEKPITPEQQEAWLALLTDLRLVIGVRQGVTEETMEMSVDPSNPSHAPLFVLHYLGSLQESLVRSIQGSE